MHIIKVLHSTRRVNGRFPHSLLPAGTLAPECLPRQYLTGAETAWEGEDMEDGRTNDEVAGALDRIALLLEEKGENPFRIRSYRKAAATVRSLDGSVIRMARQQPDELEELPGIGSGLAGAIREYAETGSISLLRRLEEERDPVEAMQRVPGIGEELAERVAEELGVRTLPELEQAAHDGRLEELRGFGESRVRGVRDSLASMLSRSGSGSGEQSPPDVELLLDLDRRYRRKAKAGELRTIAPKRFNPQGKARLPIMEVSREGWEFTVLYSNTKRAHDRDATRDWVVIYWEDHSDGQCTVVTARRGRLKGRRVVRGREPESRRHYGLDG